MPSSPSSSAYKRQRPSDRPATRWLEPKEPHEWTQEETDEIMAMPLPSSLPGSPRHQTPSPPRRQAREDLDGPNPRDPPEVQAVWVKGDRWINNFRRTNEAKDRFAHLEEEKIMAA